MNSLTFETRVNAEHLVAVPYEVPVGTLVRIHVEPLTGDALVDKHLAMKRQADPAMILNRDVIF